MHGEEGLPTLNGMNASRGQSGFKKRDGLNAWGSSQYRAENQSDRSKKKYSEAKYTIIMDSRGAYMELCSFGNGDGGLFTMDVTRVQCGILCALFQHKRSLVQAKNDSISVIKQPRLYRSQLGINAMFHRIRFKFQVSE